MNGAWCVGCKEDVPLRAAIEGLPCHCCGCTEYAILAPDDEGSIAVCDARAELFMQKGMWSEAEKAYRSCSQLEPSERNLRMATLQWRHDCAQYIDRTLNEAVDLSDFKQDILDRYDSFVADWILQNYQ